MTPTEVRLQLHRNGYHPVPCNGKEPTLEKWPQKLDANPAEIDLWDSLWPSANNTGVLTRLTPCLDIDVFDQDAADAVEMLVRERYEDAGRILVRFGWSPKRAIPFRTTAPFKKIRAVSDSAER